MAVSIDWGNLGFSYTQTACHIRYVWRDGTWSGGDLVEDPYLSVHVAATGLHYGQSGFEGLKAFKGQDGRVRIFRPDANGERLVRTAQRVCMPEIPVQMFKDACLRIVEANLDYVPPYESDGALYIRPLLFGSGARIGLQPADPAPSGLGRQSEAEASADYRLWQVRQRALPVIEWRRSLSVAASTTTSLLCTSWQVPH